MWYLRFRRLRRLRHFESLYRQAPETDLGGLSFWWNMADWLKDTLRNKRPYARFVLALTSYDDD